MRKENCGHRRASEARDAGQPPPSAGPSPQLCARLPIPCVLRIPSRVRLCDPTGRSPPGPSAPGSPGKGPGVGGCALLQGTFRTQGWDPRRLYASCIGPSAPKGGTCVVSMPPALDLPHPRVGPASSLRLLHWQEASLPPAPPGKPSFPTVLRIFTKI